MTVQITFAADGHADHLRMKRLLEPDCDSVGMLTPVSAVGTERTGHKITVGAGPVQHDDTLTATLALIERALRRA